MLIIGILAGGIGLLVGLFWLQNRVWGPWQKRRMMQRRPFTDLPLHGFQPTENACTIELTGPAAAVTLAYVGQRRGYATEISFGWSDRPKLEVRVFFDPGSKDYDAVRAVWERDGQKISSSADWFLTPYYADSAIQYDFTPPKVERLLQVADTLIERVQGLGRRPLAYAEACRRAQEFLAESARRHADKRGRR